eukprot:3433836-Amphidinium_carterae.1
MEDCEKDVFTHIHCWCAGPLPRLEMYFPFFLDFSDISRGPEDDVACWPDSMPNGAWNKTK